MYNRDILTLQDSQNLESLLEGGLWINVYQAKNNFCWAQAQAQLKVYPFFYLQAQPEPSLDTPLLPSPNRA